MKRIITTLIVSLILASLSSVSPADELEIETKEDCLQALQGKEAEIERLQQELVEKEAEIERLKNLCRKHGINTTEKEITTPKEPEVIKVLNDPIFGIRLGEDLTSIKRRYKPYQSEVQFEIDSSDLDYTKLLQNIYWYNSNLPDVNFSGFALFENKVSAISVLLSDTSKSNFLAVIKEIKSKYQVLNVEVISDDEVKFLVSIDGEDVTISVVHKKGFMEADTLSLRYDYNKLIDLSIQKSIDQKGTEIKKHL
jgi:uncharacterized protein YfkK (UPF0435 family)